MARQDERKRGDRQPDDQSKTPEKGAPTSTSDDQQDIRRKKQGDVPSSGGRRGNPGNSGTDDRGSRDE